MNTPLTLDLLCAGAAQGLVRELTPRLLEASGATVSGRFGAVGAMKEAFDAGEPCDLIVLTDAMIAAMAGQGTVDPQTRAPLGRVRTGVAVRAGMPHPDVSTPEALARALEAADAVYFPDPQRATAGIHFERVLRELGLLGPLGPRLRTFPNGATAMRELAASTSATPIGCTQVTEILYTPGVELVAPLPPRFELATVYTVAVSARTAHADLAARFIAMLAGADSAALRERCGFEPAAAPAAG
jgi:molybdate transport system substrate-binding protein